MVRNNASNDEDFVLPTVYPNQPAASKKKAPPQPGPLPDFVPLHINNNNKYGRPNLPHNVDPGDAYGIFKLFFTDELLDKLVDFTNRYAELHPTPEDKQPKGRPRAWKPVCKLELHAYFAVLIHMGIHIEPTIEDYWRQDFRRGTIHICREYISCTRWQQIDRYFYCTIPQEDRDEAFHSTFERIWDLSEYV